MAEGSLISQDDLLEALTAAGLIPRTVIGTGGTKRKVLHQVRLEDLLPVINQLAQGCMPDEDRVAFLVMDHIKTMYPQVWAAMHSTCRLSVKNTVKREIGNSLNQSRNI